MKKKFLAFAIALIGMGMVFTSCGDDEPEDSCSNEIAEEVTESLSCEKPISPQICTVDGVDDHWVLDDKEYACPDQDCSVIPDALIKAMQENYGCGTSKSVDMIIAKQKISAKAKIILANLKMESTLCSN